MSRIIRRHWPGNPNARTRRGRLSCVYEAYGPDLLMGRSITFDGNVAADITDAEAAINRLNAAASARNGVRQIQDRWRTQLGSIRRGSATDLLIRWLPGAPILTVNGAAELIERSFPQTNQAVTRLADAGILSRVTVGKRNRAFEAKEIIDAFTDLERQIASPAGDT